MRLVGPPLLDAFPNAILNVHPSLLPAFPGVDAQSQALEHGVRVSGATVHLVTGELDGGPIVLQAAVPVLDEDTPATLAGAHPDRGAPYLSGSGADHPRWRMAHRGTQVPARRGASPEARYQPASDPSRVCGISVEVLQQERVLEQDSPQDHRRIHQRHTETSQDPSASPLNGIAATMPA